MGIEKMTFLDIGGHTDDLDDVLIVCIRSGLFQLEYASKLSEYSVGESVLLRNPFGALYVKAGEISSQLNIPPLTPDRCDLRITAGDRDKFLSETDTYLTKVRSEYPSYFEKRNKLQEEKAAYSAALDMLAHLESPDINFDKVFSEHFLKVRFGRIPSEKLAEMSPSAERPYELYKLDDRGGSTWGLYVTADEFSGEVDKYFAGSGFERLRIPEFVHGTAGDAITSIRQSLSEEEGQLQEAEQELQKYIDQERDRFAEAYTRIKFLHDAYDLRRYAVSIRDHFHLIGYVRTRDEEEFVKSFKVLPNVQIKAEAASANSRIQAPVELKNNWFAKPFEMFVTMYGSPSYNDIDPTPFVAWTYSLLFGMMFGDLGHGLCVWLAGMLMWKLKKMPLGRILTRVAFSSMFFGFWYGSVFGFEHLLDPVFRAMGFAEKPIEVMRPSTTNTILIAAIGIGAVIILMSILFNILVGIKHKDYERVFLSSNGLSGFVFYAAVLLGAVFTLLGYQVFSLPYILFLIVLPLALIFFREPISRYVKLRAKDSDLHHNAELTQMSLGEQLSANIPALFNSQFMRARFGRIPSDSYKKLHFYSSEPFVLYPIKTDLEYIWLVYACALSDKDEIDAIFHDLYFERIFIPDEDMESPEATAAFIKKCLDAGGLPSPVPDETEAEKNQAPAPNKRRTTFQRVFPDGVGAFFTETFFEMFEVLLSFVTNTMSFLRVGGFILVHAGMMSVVFTLAQMVGAGANIFVIIFGNVFVMALEGLIVGIQVLRLEFYEMFSRFYDAEGTPFAPMIFSCSTGIIENA
ncbi:MAG: V-type ATP synthase subunit I [Oscillospiraceae bacterium]